MKTSIAVLALFGLIDARHHHHHSSLAQGEPKAVTPDSNRASFEASVASAAATVATEHSSEKTRTSTHAAAMASQKAATFDKNAATRTKYVNNNVANNVVHDQWVVRTDPSTLNTAVWAQTSAPEKKAVTPDSNRASFEASVATAAGVVATEHSSEKTRTSTHAAAMASQKKATFDKNAATRTKYVNENVANNVVHNQWVVRSDPSTLNTAIWAQTSAPEKKAVTPDSNRASFEASVAAAAATVATEHSSEKTRTSTHAAAMASQKKATFDKNAATRTKYVNNNVANNVVHDQWVVRTDPSTLNTAVWA